MTGAEVEAQAAKVIATKLSEGTHDARQFPNAIARALSAAGLLAVPADPAQAADLSAVRRMLDNPISARLADGWYPSGRDDETGDVRHDRHVLIWVRQYEAMLRALADRLDGYAAGLTATPEQDDAAAGVKSIAAERQRQIAAEGWTLAHDDGHREGELAAAAANYARVAAHQTYRAFNGPPMFAAALSRGYEPDATWTWDMEWWKPSADPIRNLVKAGALIAAEIDRLQRLGAAPAVQEEAQTEQAGEATHRQGAAVTARDDYPRLAAGVPRPEDIVAALAEIDRLRALVRESSERAVADGKDGALASTSAGDSHIQTVLRRPLVQESSEPGRTGSRLVGVGDDSAPTPVVCEDCAP